MHLHCFSVENYRSIATAQRLPTGERVTTLIGPNNEGKSIVEDAALEWFGELGYAVGHGSHLAPGEQAEGTLTPALSHEEREKREAIRRLNVSIPEEAYPWAWTADRLATIRQYRRVQVSTGRETTP